MMEKHWTVLWRPTRPSRTNTQKRGPFQYRRLECKSRKSRNTWSNKQIWPWSSEGSKAKFCQKNALFIANTLFQQNKRRLYTWMSSDGQYWNKTHYIICSQRWRSSIQTAKTRLGTDCGSDHELLIARFRLKLKKVGKTTRTFTYDQNQTPYYYIVEVANNFKGLDLILIVPEELWMEVHDCTGGSDQDHPQEKEMHKCKMVVWGHFPNSCEKKRSKRHRAKGKIYPF